MVRIILACTNSGGIGKNNKLPWYTISEDMKLFMNITIGNTIVMGRKTWDSLPIKPLPNRKNIVISSSTLDLSTFPNTFQVSSIEDAIYQYPKALFIGGASIYNYLIENNLVSEAHISIIKKDYDADTFVDIQSLRNQPHNIKTYMNYNQFTYLHILFSQKNDI